MIDYKKITDKELLELYQKGDQWAFDEINERYKDTVRFHARFFYLTGGDGEDILQEGMIGLFEATNTYREEKNASFATFADICIKSRIIKAVKSDNKKSNRPLNTSLSLEARNDKKDIEDDREPDYSLESDGGAGNPEDIVISKELQRIVMERIGNILSEFEKKIFDLYMSGKGLSDISNEIGVPYKSVENAFSRIKQKVRKKHDELFDF